MVNDSISGELLSKINIYFRITSECNSNCDFCYRDFKGAQGQSLGEIKELISKAKSLGFIRIVFLGGEPFLRKDFESILKFAKQKEFLVNITTNGSLIGDKEIKFLNKYVSWVGIPLDGSNQKESSKIRSSLDQFSITTNLLKKFKINKPNFKVRISTLITKENKSDISNIGNLLFNSPEMYKPDGWRLEHFKEIETDKKAAEKYLMSKNDFDEIVKEQQNIFGKQSIVSPSNGNYMIINTNSDLTLSDSSGYRNKGKFLELTNKQLINKVGMDFINKIIQNSSWRYT